MESSKDVRKELEDILGQREYQVYYENEQNIIQSWWAGVKEWFRDLLSELFSDLNPSNGFADTLLIIIIGVVVLLALLVIFLFVRSSVRKRSVKRRQPFQTTSEMEWSVARHLKEANRQEQLENYALATRHQFLAVLLYFHKRHWLQARTWKTNWEYFSELERKDKEIAKSFYDLARIFDEVFYGERQIDYQDYQMYREKAGKWLEALDTNGDQESGREA